MLALLVACGPPAATPDAAPAAPAATWSIRLDVDLRVDAPAEVWSPRVDGSDLVVASSRVGTVRVRRADGRVVLAVPRLPAEPGLRQHRPDQPGLLGSAGRVEIGAVTVSSLDEALQGEERGRRLWSVERFAWVPGAVASVDGRVVAWQLELGKVRRVELAPESGQVVRAGDAVSGHRLLAAAIAPDGRAVIVTETHAHLFDAAGARVHSQAIPPPPDAPVRALPTAAILAGREAYVFLDGRTLLRLPDLPTP